MTDVLGQPALGQHALEYLRAGLHLLALSGKRPNPVYHEHWDWQNSIHGLPETEEQYDALGRVFSGSTTGIAILIPEHFLVADVDSEVAAGLFMELAGELPHVPTSRTKNGLHLWFYAPGAAGSVWLGDRALLFKGYGGYVVAPPSAHPDGGRYEWIEPLVADGRLVGLEPLPQKIADRMRVNAFFEDQRRERNESTSMWTMQAERIGDGPWSWAAGTLKFSFAWDLTGLERAIETAPEGNQNNLIAWAALTAQEEGVPYSVAMDRLLAAAVKGGHPSHRAKTTIKGVYQRRGNSDAR